VILKAKSLGVYTASLQRLSPMSRTFTLVALVTTFSIIVVLGMVLIRDINWLSNIGSDSGYLDDAERAVRYEIIFVVAALMAMVMNVIVSWSRNLKLLFANQTGILEQVTNGDLSGKVPVTTADEFGVIAQHTNKMIDGLKHRIALLGALKVAEEVQRNLLPKAPPKVPGLELAAISKYSEETGGDYYDFMPLSNGRLAVAVGDVSGHGVGSALLMASARASLRMAWDAGADIADIITRVNKRLAKDVDETGRFLTLFLLEVDPASKKLKWVAGGHDPALLYDPVSDDFSELGGRGLAVGVLEGAKYEVSHRIGWEPGSILLVGTDGIWETHNDRHEMFGKERLKEIIRAHASASPQSVVDAIINALNDFREGSVQEDDITMVLLKLV
jgi:sigma-B regulation protein RsbU (phosphoserine phosphatase)